jgi:hypothetical protein
MLAMLAIVSFTSEVFAEPPDPEKKSSGDEHQSKVLRPDIGVDDPRLIPGVGGYKVFDRQAFTSAQAQRSFVTLAPPQASDPWRYAATDAYVDDKFIGAHSSSSDLDEDEIKVNGAMRRSDNQVWYASCEDKKVGHVATCSESVNPSQGRHIAHGWHKYHEPGDIDTSFETEDSLQDW